jgi:hypothetical protein
MKKPTYDELLKDYATIRSERDHLKSELEKALNTLLYLEEQKKAMTRKYSDLT